MSIFAKRISKAEIDAIYKHVRSIADHLIRLEDMYFGSLFENESEEDKSFRLLNAEEHALFAIRENWLKSRTPIRTIVGRTADIKELIAEKHNYSYSFVCDLYDLINDRIIEYKKNDSTEEVEMACAKSFFDNTIGIAMEDNGISAEEVGHDYIAMVCVLLAGALAKEE